jgi:hypothetical protein
MAVYKFTIAMAVDSMLPRDYMTNTIHMEHVGGIALDTDLDGVCDDLVDLYQYQIGGTPHEVRCKAYDMSAPPNYPLANVVKSAGTPYTSSLPREIAICLSFARNKSNPRERGRIYIPACFGAVAGLGIAQRPGSTARTNVLKYYSEANHSFPDIGGIDWKFGVWSPTNNAFYQTTQAWVDDEYDTVRSRGLRPEARTVSVRDG